MKFLNIYILLFLNILFLISCVETPTDDDSNFLSQPSVGAVILCEGLKGFNNSTLTRISLDDYSSERNSFSKRTGENLGDTANDILLKGDTAFIAVTASNRIEIINISNGELINSIQLPDNFYPRKFVIADKYNAYFTNLRNHSITHFNPETFEIINESIYCGFFPEDIEYYNGNLYIANSALGYFYKDNPLAGTITVMDESSKEILDFVKIGQNMQEIEISEKHNKLIALYYNTYEKDSVGGIAALDISTMKITNHLKTNGINLYKSSDDGRIYFFRQTPKGQQESGWRGIAYYDIEEGKIYDFIENEVKTEFWYGMEFRDNEIWICNAKNFTVNGEIIILDYEGYEINRIETGINPNNIRFY